jgi:hypothetical protein
MPTPQDVEKAVNSPTFYQNPKQFWQMMCYLLSKHEGEFVWKLIKVESFKLIMEQLQVVIENTAEYSTIQSNKNLLYHIYITALERIKGGRSVAEFMAYEDTTVLKAFHYLYKQLFQLKITLPLFGHLPEK